MQRVPIRRARPQHHTFYVLKVTKGHSQWWPKGILIADLVKINSMLDSLAKISSCSLHPVDTWKICHLQPFMHAVYYALEQANTAPKPLLSTFPCSKSASQLLKEPTVVVVWKTRRDMGAVWMSLRISYTSLEPVNL